jgi:hypothetical protein
MSWNPNFLELWLLAIVAQDTRNPMMDGDHVILPGNDLWRRGCAVPWIPTSWRGAPRRIKIKASSTQA